MGMTRSVHFVIGSLAALMLAALVVACSSTDDSAPAPATTPPPKPAAAPAPAPVPAPAPAKAAEKATEAKAAKTKAVEVEGVISAVGQRTITFQVERKGKVREEVVGVDDKTKIEKGGNNIKLGDIQETDQALINYEPEA